MIKWLKIIQKQQKYQENVLNDWSDIIEEEVDLVKNSKIC